MFECCSSHDVDEDLHGPAGQKFESHVEGGADHTQQHHHGSVEHIS